MNEYSRVAPLYDLLITPVLRPIYQGILTVLNQHECTTAMDLCCGTGALAGMMVRAGLNATGVDSSSAMLHVARQKHSARFIRADATALPLPDSGFDAVSISFGLHEKPQPTARQILAEAKRIVRPDGIIIVADYRQPESKKGFWTGQIIGLIERLAGREHHAHFNRYMDTGGTDGFLRTAGFPGHYDQPFMYGWAGIYVIG